MIKKIFGMLFCIFVFLVILYDTLGNGFCLKKFDAGIHTSSITDKTLEYIVNTVLDEHNENKLEIFRVANDTSIISERSLVCYLCYMKVIFNDLIFTIRLN